MDRHDVPGVKAEDVAQAHMSDVAAEAKHGVKFLAYWFDPDQGEAFCLAQAPAAESLTAVHRETHGLIPNEIISVKEDNILRFLGKINDPVDHATGNPFRAILFTDLEGSTSLLESVGEAPYMVPVLRWPQRRREPGRLAPAICSQRGAPVQMAAWRTRCRSTMPTATPGCSGAVTASGAVPC
jgi:hypothetical protein